MGRYYCLRLEFISYGCEYRAIRASLDDIGRYILYTLFV